MVHGSQLFMDLLMQSNLESYFNLSHIIYFNNCSELRGLRSKLFPSRLPKLDPKLKARSVVHKSNFVGDRYVD